MYEVTERFEKTLAPIAGHFTTVTAFQSFLLVNLHAHSIMQSAQSSDADARAWSKAYYFIIQTLHGGRLLDNSIVDEAVMLAESHMQQGDADSSVFQASTSADMTPVERFYKKCFEELEAKMNKFEQRCGKRGERGDRKDNGNTRESKGARVCSTDRDGKRKGSGDPPKCDNPKCLSGGKHWGKCFAELDFEKERECLAVD